MSVFHTLLACCIVAALHVPHSQAQILGYYLTNHEGSPAVSVYLNPNGFEFDKFHIEFIPSTNTEFLNYGPGGITDTAGKPKTFTNAYLGAPLAFGGDNLIVTGTEDDGPQGISYTATAPTGLIDSSREYFLSNIYIAYADFEPLNYRLKLTNGGQSVFSISRTPHVPEPGALYLTLCGLLVMWPRRFPR